MSASASKGAFEEFEEIQEESKTKLEFWDQEERLQAVQDVMNCANQSSSTIDGFMEALRKTLGVGAAFMSYLVKGCVLRQKRSDGEESGGLCSGAPGFCFWTLVPEQPQALVIEDALLDARTSNSALVTDKPYIRSYAAAPLVTSNRQRIGTVCVLDDQPRTFTLDEVAIICNFAELIMRILEGQVLQRRPQSSVLSGQHPRGLGAYHQAFAVVDAANSDWPILASTTAFNEMTGKEKKEQRVSFWCLFEGKGGTREMVKEGPTSGLDCEWQIQQMKPHNRSYALCASVLDAARDFDPSHQLIGIPCLFSKGARRSGKPRKHCSTRIFFILLTLESDPRPRRHGPKPPIADLRLLSPLGSGSYAKVYRGLHGKKRVAVKIVHHLAKRLQTGNNPSEPVLMQAVSHPNLLKVFEWKLAENARKEERLWLILELCDGGDIADSIDKGLFRESPKSDAPLSTRTVLATFRELVSGLKALHDNGILHCDISGGNVFIDSSDKALHGFTVKIGDFGLARRDSSADLGTYSGSYSYLAPEVLKKGHATQASDCYSLGVLFYEILCGERAWGGLHPTQIYYAVVERKEIPGWPEGVPQQLQSIAAKLLQYDSKDRCTLTNVLQAIEAQLERL